MYYYDDQKRLIATTIDGLLTYFRSISGVVYAETVDLTVPCNPTAIIQITGTSALPKFIYAGQPIPKNKIYPKRLPSNTIDLTALCNGSNINNIVPIPDCGDAVFVEFVLPPPDCGTPIFIPGYDQIVTLTPNTADGWQIYDATLISSVSDEGVVTMNISVINPGITTHTLFSFQLILMSSFNAWPQSTIDMDSDYHPNIPTGSAIRLEPTGDIAYSGYETALSDEGAVITIFNVQFNINN